MEMGQVSNLVMVMEQLSTLLCDVGQDVVPFSIRERNSITFDEKNRVLFVLQKRKQQIVAIELLEEEHIRARPDVVRYNLPKQVCTFDHYHDVAFDLVRGWIVLLTRYCAQAWSYTKGTFMLLFESRISDALYYTINITIDYERERLLLIAHSRERAICLSQNNLDYLYCIELDSMDARPPASSNTSWLSSDEVGRALLICPNGLEAYVYLQENGAFLYPLQNDLPWTYFDCTCTVNRGRLISGDTERRCLLAFSAANGQQVAETQCFEQPESMIFDHLGGHIFYLGNGKVFVIEANQWLPGTYVWSPNTQRFAPESVSRVVRVMTMLRAYATEHTLCLLPNELLFEIFSWL